MKKLMSCFSEEELRTFDHLMEKLREKAFEELAPGEPMGEVQINDVKNIARFVARTRED